MLVADIEDRKTWRSNRATSHDIFRVDIIFSYEDTDEEVVDEVLTPSLSLSPRYLIYNAQRPCHVINRKFMTIIKIGWGMF